MLCVMTQASADRRLRTAQQHMFGIGGDGQGIQATYILLLATVFVLERERERERERGGGGGGWV